MQSLSEVVEMTQTLAHVRNRIEPRSGLGRRRLQRITRLGKCLEHSRVQLRVAQSLSDGNSRGPVVMPLLDQGVTVFDLTVSPSLEAGHSEGVAHLRFRRLLSM